MLEKLRVLDGENIQLDLHIALLDFVFHLQRTNLRTAKNYGYVVSIKQNKRLRFFIIHHSLSTRNDPSLSYGISSLRWKYSKTSKLYYNIDIKITCDHSVYNHPPAAVKLYDGPSVGWISFSEVFVASEKMGPSRNVSVRSFGRTWRLASNRGDTVVAEVPSQLGTSQISLLGGIGRGHFWSLIWSLRW